MRIYNATNSQLNLPFPGGNVSIAPHSVSGNLGANTQTISMLVSAYDASEIAFVVSGPFELNLCSSIPTVVNYVVQSLEEAIEKLEPKSEKVAEPVIVEEPKKEEKKEKVFVKKAKVQKNEVKEVVTVEKPKEVKEDTVITIAESDGINCEAEDACRDFPVPAAGPYIEEEIFECELKAEAPAEEKADEEDSPE